MNIDISIWLAIALALSVGVNIFLIWYIRRIVAKLLFVSANLNDLVEVVKNYGKHLKQVYSLDMFYGDETLKFLMSHTNSLLEILRDYEDVYDITIPLESTGEAELDNTEKNRTEEEEEEIAPPEINEENVFYAGSRKRDN